MSDKQGEALILGGAMLLALLAIAVIGSGLYRFVELILWLT